MSLTKLGMIFSFGCSILSSTANNNENAWWNFTTEKYDCIEGDIPETEILNYLPQVPAVMGLYEVYRMQGMDYLEAYIQTLLTVLPKEDSEAKKELER
jgi:hypothetical protein